MVGELWDAIRKGNLNAIEQVLAPFRKESKLLQQLQQETNPEVFKLKAKQAPLKELLAQFQGQRIEEKQFVEDDLDALLEKVDTMEGRTKVCQVFTNALNRAELYTPSYTTKQLEVIDLNFCTESTAKLIEEIKQEQGSALKRELKY